MTKLEAWEAWCESAGTPDLATEFTLEQSSHGKAFSFAWERGFVDGMQHQMQSSVEKEPFEYWNAVEGWVKIGDTEHVDKTAKQEHEPVAFINVEKQRLEFAKRTLFDTPTTVKLPNIPLYTAPPHRTWVGLTDDDIEECTIAAERDYERYMQATRGQQLDQRDQLDWWIARAIEAKLKERNYG